MIRLQDSVTGEVFGIDELLRSHSAKIRYNKNEYTAVTYDPLGYYLAVGQDGRLDRFPVEGSEIEEDSNGILNPMQTAWLSPMLGGSEPESSTKVQWLF